MGFFSSIGSAISSGISALGSVINSGINSLSEVLKSRGEFIGKFAMSIGGALGLGIAKFIPVLGDITFVVQAICFIAEALGLMKDNENVEELGLKAEVADKKPEDFDGTEEYINYLKDEIEVDKKKFNDLNELQLLGYKIAGSSILLGGISEKKEIFIEPTFIRDAVKIGIQNENLDKFINKFKENGASTNLADYFKGELTTKEDNRINIALQEGIKSVFPNTGVEERFDKISSIRDGYLKIED